MGKYSIGLVTGTIAGIVIATGILAGIKPIEDRSVLKTFQKEGTPKVQKLYHRLRKDSFFVEYPENSGEYILLNEYLAKIPNKTDRTIKESKIKELVGF